MYRLILTLAILLAPFTFSETNQLAAAWQGNNEQSTTVIDNSIWQSFLTEYLHKDIFGQTYFQYAKVTFKQKNQLRKYIDSLQAINPLNLSMNEEKAYWINLYNALTVIVILDNYPTESIKKIGGLFGGLIPTGPWDLELARVNGVNLSLNNIEHDIVRPKFKDHRIHFALNCAAKGCPNLSEKTYSSGNIEDLLSTAENTFVNHQRGARFQGKKLILSSIFDWYGEDFAPNSKALLIYLSNNAEPKLRVRLKSYAGKIRYEYDWSLNEVK